MLMRSGISSDIMQRRVVIPYLRFRTTFFDFLSLKDGKDRLSRNVGNELPLDAALYPSREQISKVGYSGSEDYIFSDLLYSSLSLILV